MENQAAAGAEARRLIYALQWTRCIRAIGQGTLLVTFSLYLKELGWTAAAIGLLFSAGGIVSAIAGWVIGVVSDHFGRKGFLLAYEAAVLVGSLVLLGTSQAAVLTVVSLIVGFGRSQSGVAGMAAAADQVWLAEGVPMSKRGGVYSQNAALGFLGMSVGSLIAGAVPFFRPYFPGVLAYRPFFLLLALGAVVDAVLLWSAPERVDDLPLEPATNGGGLADPRGASKSEAGVRREENGIMFRMALINGFNGVAVGLTSPLLAYWFNLKFGVGPGALGPVFAVTFLVTGLASLWTGRLTEKIGIVRSVVMVRLGAVGLLLMLPVMPTFLLAAAVHVFRSAMGRSTIGARRALAVNLIRPHRRGLASSVNNMSMALPNAVGPSIAGVFLETGHLAMPFLIGAGLQFLYGTFYGRAFQGYEDRLTQSHKKQGVTA